MTDRTVEASPRPKARITGVVYLLYFLTAVLGVFLIRGLVVSGDAAATANNLLAHERLFRLSVAVGLIGTALYIAVKQTPPKSGSRKCEIKLQCAEISVDCGASGILRMGKLETPCQTHHRSSHIWLF